MTNSTPQVQRSRLDRLVDGLYLAIPLIVIGVISGFIVNDITAPTIGMSFDPTWDVRFVEPCSDHPNWCQGDRHVGDIRVGDDLLEIGGLSVDEFAADNYVTPFPPFEPGDSFLIKLARGTGETIETVWRTPPASTAYSLSRIFNASLYIPFWGSFYVFGLLVTLMVRPRGTEWRLFIATSFLFAIWLAVGGQAAPLVFASRVVAGAAGWLLAAVLLHLNIKLVFPDLLFARRWVLWVGYSVTALGAALTVLNLLSARAYLAWLLAAILASVVLLIVRVLGPATHPNRGAASLVLLGTAMALIPGTVVVVLRAAAPEAEIGLASTLLAIIALPALPAFFSYGVFRRQIGLLRVRANQLLGDYAFFLLFATLLLTVFTIFETTADVREVQLALQVVSLGFLLSIAPWLRGGFMAFFNRVSYGTTMAAERIMRQVGPELVALTTQDEVVALISEQILPTLFIRQSALYVLNPDGNLCKYMAYGVSLPDLVAHTGRLNPARVCKDEALFAWSKLCLPVISQGETRGVWLFGTRDPDDFYPPRLIEILSGLSSQVSIAVHNSLLIEALRQSNEETRATYRNMLISLARALDVRDRDTEGHSERVALLTVALARAMGVNDIDELRQVRDGALLHDMGKIGIPDAILHKPGPLSTEEWLIMYQHPYLAYKVLADQPNIQELIDIPLFHHERWDGSGYPFGLSGHTIPLAARMFAVVDVWDALTHDRPYREAWSPERARSVLEAETGTHFDPDVARAFLVLLDDTPELREIRIDRNGSSPLAETGDLLNK